MLETVFINSVDIQMVYRAKMLLDLAGIFFCWGKLDFFGKNA